jgi:cation transport regulator
MPLPYLTNADLPRDVRQQLPVAAQDLYRTAFNAAVDNIAHDPVEDADAHNLAWEAVKRSYVKEGDEWVERGVLG